MQKKINWKKLNRDVFYNFVGKNNIDDLLYVFEKQCMNIHLAVQVFSRSM